ncbi:MAG: hypothetical protein RIC36_14265 [Rhodospirillales bacterium]
MSVTAFTAAFAASTEGTVVAFDRKAKVIVLDDKTVWTIVGSEDAVPATLKAGDVIVIDYVSTGDDGIQKISTITIK